MRISLFAIVFINSISFASYAEVKLPRLVSTGMVLQRDTKLKIWGWCDANEKVTIHFRDHEYTAGNSKDGMWSIDLPPQTHGGPFTMQVIGNNTVTIDDILIGDVWLCSGQSNMVLPIDRVKDRYPTIIQETNNIAIRQFAVPTSYNFQGPQSDLSSGKWEAATTGNVPRFSAVILFFAKALYEKYHMPQGFINTAVGGSPAQAWLSHDALKKFPTYYAEATKFSNASFVDSIRRGDEAARKMWYEQIQQNDDGLHDSRRWSDPSLNDHEWQTMPVPSYWDEHGLKNVHGVVWFRKNFDARSAMKEKLCRLFLGNVADQDSVYINGVFIGTTGYQYPPRKYPIPAGVLREHDNVIAVRVINTSGRGGFYKGKPYQIFCDSDTINLAGDWRYKVGVNSQALPPSTTFQYQSGGLYNAMIAPLTFYSFNGILWYQGESNAEKPLEYKQLLSTLIVDWRKHFGRQKLPFLYVQLANYMQTVNEPRESNWATLREQQRLVLSVPYTAMAVAIDAGEWNDIHPTNKKVIGERLALAAQTLVYHEKDIVSSGPTLKSFRVNGNKIILTFQNVGSGLISKGDTSLKYFSIAGTDGKFVWAQAELKGNDVIVWNENISNPSTVRYAWADNPEGANLYNREGLPASPFSTDSLRSSQRHN